jgi:nucleoside-diphosphate-sugar epimerase
LVTGATGFVGSHLAEVLLERGYRVTCLVRKSSNLRWLSGLEVEYAYGDIADQDSLRGVVENVDLVFHSAGLTKAKNREEYFRGNAEGTRNLVEACLEGNTKLQRFVYVSSQAAVGPGADEKPLNENAPCRPITDYGESKLAGEKIVREHSLQLPVTIVRPPAVYGPRDADVLGFFKVASRGFRVSFGKGESFLSLVYIKDLVDGIIRAAENRKSIGQTYFIADDRVYSWREAFNIIAEVLEKRTIPLRTPKRVVLFLALISESFSGLFGKPATFNTQKAREITQRYWGLDVSKARAELGFSARYDLERGAAETVKWYRDKRWL